MEMPGGASAKNENYDSSAARMGQRNLVAAGEGFDRFLKHRLLTWRHGR